jgi:hypothetical protein
MLARGTAAEIIAGDQDLGLAIGRLVKHEIRVLAAVVAEALFREQALAESGALDGFQILLGDDHVGVDIDHFHRRGDAFENGEFFHCLTLKVQSCDRHLPALCGELMASRQVPVKPPPGRFLLP